MTKKSAEIIGLPVISITEGRELGISKTLVIDAKCGAVAAITIEDEDWYRGVKLLPFSSVIAIGHDAVTVTNSENILTLEESSDFEALLDANIRILGTKAITKTGTINGKVSEIFIDDDGMVVKIQIVAPDGAKSEIPSDEISIFGKQVTVIGDPGDGSWEKPVFTPAKAAPAPEPLPEPEPVPEPIPEPLIIEDAPEIAPEPEPAIEMPTPQNAIEPEPEPAIEPPTVESAPEITPAPDPMIAPEPETAPPPSSPKKKKATTTKKAKPAANPASAQKQPKSAEKATMDRHRRFLLGKKAARDIVAASGFVVAKAGDEITEAMLHNAQLAGKLIELSMNVQ